MKKTIITIALATAAIASTYAQGLVVFNNTSTTKLSTNSVPGGPATGVTGAVANGYYFALFYSATATTVNGSAGAAVPGATGVGTWVTSDASWTANNVLGGSTSAGRFASLSPNGDGSTTVTGVAAGSSANYVVLGWSANIATTLAGFESWLANPVIVAGADFIGESVVATGLTAGNGGSIPNTGLFGTVSPFMQGFTLGEVAAVPEPGTLALAALGVSSLLMLRRKK